MVTAVDAVATFPAFTCGLLIAPRVSFWRNEPMHLASAYILLYKDAAHLVIHTSLTPFLCASGIAADTLLLPRAIVDPLACASIL
jgi:hypothetical protein